MLLPCDIYSWAVVYFHTIRSICVQKFYKSIFNMYVDFYTCIYLDNILLAVCYIFDLKKSLSGSVLPGWVSESVACPTSPSCHQLLSSWLPFNQQAENISQSVCHLSSLNSSMWISTTRRNQFKVWVVVKASLFPAKLSSLIKEKLKHCQHQDTQPRSHVMSIGRKGKR